MQEQIEVASSGWKPQGEEVPESAPTQSCGDPIVDSRLTRGQESRCCLAGKPPSESGNAVEEALRSVSGGTSSDREQALPITHQAEQAQPGLLAFSLGSKTVKAFHFASSPSML